MGGSAGEGAVVTLLQSAQGHIPLLGQCCLVNRSASCLWLLSFLLNINGQIPSSQPPLLPTPTFCLSLPADSSHKDSLLTFLKCLNCKRVFSKPETSSARRKKGESVASASWKHQGGQAQGLALHSFRLQSRQWLRGPVPAHRWQMGLGSNGAMASLLALQGDPAREGRQDPLVCPHPAPCLCALSGLSPWGARPDASRAKQVLKRPGVIQ